MEQINHDFEDFLAVVSGEEKAFVAEIHKMLLKENNKVKITVKGTKTIQRTVTYSEAKTRRNTAKFSLKKDMLSIHIYTKNYDKYLDVLSALPETMINQMNESHVCKNLVKQDGKGCSWPDCSGYDFYIGDMHFQKCSYYCFQFNVDAESIPFLRGIIEAELKARTAMALLCYI
ncbi:MAG: hypothetical protein FWC75_00480 [Oscillospiraceae bacterium]|nr:hypothetical protein [Oscillospiraceae bacterium]